MAPTEGTKGEDRAADDGKVEFADGKGVANGGVPGEVVVAEDGGCGPNTYCAYEHRTAAEGEDAG